MEFILIVFLIALRVFLVYSNNGSDKNIFTQNYSDIFNEEKRKFTAEFPLVQGVQKATKFKDFIYDIYLQEQKNNPFVGTGLTSIDAYNKYLDELVLQTINKNSPNGYIKDRNSFSNITQYEAYLDSLSLELSGKIPIKDNGVKAKTFNKSSDKDSYKAKCENPKSTFNFSKTDKYIEPWERKDKEKDPWNK